MEHKETNIIIFAQYEKLSFIVELTQNKGNCLNRIGHFIKEACGEKIATNRNTA